MRDSRSIWKFRGTFVFWCSLPPHPLPWGEGTPEPAPPKIRRLLRDEMDHAKTRATILPLPKGEGRGEGEQNVHRPKPYSLTKILSHCVSRLLLPFVLILV